MLSPHTRGRQWNIMALSGFTAEVSVLSFALVTRFVRPHGVLDGCIPVIALFMGAMATCTEPLDSQKRR